MRLVSGVFLLLTVLTFTVAESAHAQKDNTDTIASPKLNRSAETDALFFDAIKAKETEDDKQAVELMEKFVAAKPKEPAGWYELAKIFRNAQHKDKALDYIRKAVDLDPANKWYKSEYASLLNELGKYDEAADIMADLVQSEPSDQEYPILAAEYYEKAKKFDEAIKYIDKALQRNGNDVEILMRKMQIYLELNDVNKAAETINQLIGSDPKNGKYYKMLGEIYDNNKQVDKGSAIFEKAIKLLPDDPSVQIGYADHFLKTGDTVSYKKYIRKAIINKEFDEDLQLKLLDAYLRNMPNDSFATAEGLPIVISLLEQHPNDADLLAFYGDLLDVAGKREQALDAYKKSLGINGSRFNVWLKLLQNYSDKKDADSLIKYSESALKMFPNQALASFYNGIGHFNKKEYPPAIKAINRAIDLQPESNPDFTAVMYSTLGDIYNVTKQYELSDNAFDKSLKFNAEDATVLNNYAYYLSERGKRLDDAEKMSLKSLEIRPGEATFLDTYGWILYKKGDYSGAKDYIEQAIRKANGASDATLFDHLGNIYSKLNNTDKAIDNWKIAKDKGCDNPLLDKKITEGKLYE